MLIWSFLSTLASGNFALSYRGTMYRQEGLAVYICYAGIFSAAYLIRKSTLFIRLLNALTIVASFLSLLVLLDIPILNLS